MIWGANPKNSRTYGEPLTLERFSTAIPDAKRRGAKIIVINPRQTELAASADEWMNITVETDMAFGLSLLNVIIAEQLFDTEFVNNWTVGFDRLSQHVQGLTPEWAEKIVGVPADTIKRIARIYATTKPVQKVFNHNIMRAFCASHTTIVSLYFNCSGG